MKGVVGAKIKKKTVKHKKFKPTNQNDFQMIWGNQPLTRSKETKRGDPNPADALFKAEKAEGWEKKN